MFYIFHSFIRTRYDARMRHFCFSQRQIILLLVVPFLIVASARGAEPAITFNQNFEGGSLGTVEKLDEATFLCHVQGQYDEHGRNRQASWYYFRMDHVEGRDVVLTLTDFVGEYNGRPGACPMGPDIVPVFSTDGKHWQHFPAMGWDAEKKQATLKFHGEQESIWIAHIAPYTPSDLGRLLEELRGNPHAAVEVIGRTAHGREITRVTVTNTDVPDSGKKTVWLQARQHAWEAGTSYVMEGALRFITSDAPAAVALRDKVVFQFTPMVDVDGCAEGKVRFNANGYDVNRHWDEVDLRHPAFLRSMPEIWYTKKALVVEAARRPIDLMVNMHNTETNEYLGTRADDEATLKMMRRLDAMLAERTSFDPSQKLGMVKVSQNDTNSLFTEARIPVLLMEQRIGTSRKLGRRPTVEDRLRFGKELVGVMGEVVTGRE